MTMPIFDIKNTRGTKQYRPGERFTVEVEFDVDPVTDFEIIQILDGEEDVTEFYADDSDIHQAIFDYIDEYDRPDPDDKYDERYDF